MKFQRFQFYLKHRTKFKGMISSIQDVQETLKKQQDILLNHPLYEALADIDDIRVFQQYHVFAVWDFMSLLKALQREITCVKTPWFPDYPANLRRLINEIVLEEETDVNLKGEYTSHYDLYLEAMREAGAKADLMHHLQKLIKEGERIESGVVEMPAAICNFLKFTFGTIETGELHRIASAFTFGREDLIPGMFKELVKDVEKRHPGKLKTYVYYLDRHIELDDGVHGPLAYKMVELLCGNDQKKWLEVADTAKVALKQRIALWDHILKQIKAAKKQKLVSA